MSPSSDMWFPLRYPPVHVPKPLVHLLPFGTTCKAAPCSRYRSLAHCQSVGRLQVCCILQSNNVILEMATIYLRSYVRHAAGLERRGPATLTECKISSAMVRDVHLPSSVHTFILGLGRAAKQEEELVLSSQRKLTNQNILNNYQKS